MKRHMMVFVVLLIAGVSQAFAEGEACPANTEVSVTIEIIDDFVIPMSALTGQGGVQGYAACTTYYEYRSYADWWNGHCADIDEKWTWNNAVTGFGAVTMTTRSSTATSHISPMPSVRSSR